MFIYSGEKEIYIEYQPCSKQIKGIYSAKKNTLPLLFENDYRMIDSHNHLKDAIQTTTLHIIPEDERCSEAWILKRKPGKRGEW